MTRLYLSPPHMDGDERERLLAAFDSNWITPLGPEVDGFEAELAARSGRSHGAALSSGTAALHLALILTGVGADDEVVLTKSITTNKHGKVAVRGFCTPTSPSAAGEVRFCDIKVSKKGKVTVRSTGYDSMKVVVKAKATPKKGQEDRWLPNTWRKSWKVTG